MPTNRYITLTSDDDPYTVGGRYVAIVLDPGYLVSMDKSTSKERTVGAGLDVGMGGVYEMFAYMIRLRETETDENYGDVASLKALFRLNNPGGTPSNMLKLIDHYEDTYDVFMLDGLQFKSLTTIISGEHAYFYVPVILTVKPTP